MAEAIQAVKRAKDTLNGNDNVQNAKIQATDTINNSNDLNHAQKDALNNKLLMQQLSLTLMQLNKTL